MQERQNHNEACKGETRVQDRLEKDSKQKYSVRKLKKLSHSELRYFEGTNSLEVDF